MIIGVTTIPAQVVVAVEGAVGDWTAYEGPEDWNEKMIAEQGDKISEAYALRLFPQFAHLRYRK